MAKKTAKKAAKKTVTLKTNDETVELGAGQMERFYCNECDAEFDLTYEPKARDCPQEAEYIGSKEVGYCPFCGGTVSLG